MFEGNHQQSMWNSDQNAMGLNWDFFVPVAIVVHWKAFLNYGSVSASLGGGWVLALFSGLHFWHSQFADRVVSLQLLNPPLPAMFKAWRGWEKGRKHKVGRGGVKHNIQRLKEAQ